MEYRACSVAGEVYGEAGGGQGGSGHGALVDNLLQVPAS